MNKITIILSSLILGLASGLVMAKDDDDDEKNSERSPIGCQDVGYEYRLNMVKLLPDQDGDKQSLYFLYNKNNEVVRLYHMRYEDSTQSMRLNNEISGHQWGVLSTGEKEVRFLCAVPDKNNVYGKIVSCQEYIKVCEYPNVRYGMNNEGNYWLIDSTTRNNAVHSVVHYGIIPG